MPVMKTSKPGKTAYKFGQHGKAYTGKGAKAKAAAQGRSMFANGYKGKSK